MARDVIALTIADLSQIAKSLRSGLDRAPGHLATLNLVVRALRRFDAAGRSTSSPVRPGHL